MQILMSQIISLAKICRCFKNDWEKSNALTNPPQIVYRKLELPMINLLENKLELEGISLMPSFSFHRTFLDGKERGYDS